MPKVMKAVRMDDSFEAKIQAVADSDFDGNFTAALIDMISCGLSIRKIPEDVRWQMKASLVRNGNSGSEFYEKNPRVVIDALQI